MKFNENVNFKELFGNINYLKFLHFKGFKNKDKVEVDKKNKDLWLPFKFINMSLRTYKYDIGTKYLKLVLLFSANEEGSCSYNKIKGKFFGK